MPSPDRLFAFLRGPRALALSAVLVVQAAVFYGFSRTETPPLHRPLLGFPTEIEGWRMVEEGVVEKEVQDVLRADDTLTRTYALPAQGLVANLFVAYFKSQRTGVSPHSPKNCLPGSGWVPSISGVVEFTAPGRPEPVKVNRYLVALGESKSVVLYWYQSRDRVIASEYAAKFQLVADAIRYNRTDTALVRVVAPVLDNREQAAADVAVRFAQASLPHLREFLPK